MLGFRAAGGPRSRCDRFPQDNSVRVKRAGGLVLDSRECFLSPGLRSPMVLVVA